MSLLLRIQRSLQVLLFISIHNKKWLVKVHSNNDKWKQRCFETYNICIFLYKTWSTIRIIVINNWLTIMMLHYYPTMKKPSYSLQQIMFFKNVSADYHFLLIRKFYRIWVMNLLLSYYTIRIETDILPLSNIRVALSS